MANGITNISGGKALSGTAQPSDVRLGMTYADGKELRDGTLDLRNLKAENIKKDVNVGGVVGDFGSKFRLVKRNKRISTLYVQVGHSETKELFKIPPNTIAVQALGLGYTFFTKMRIEGSVEICVENDVVFRQTFGSYSPSNYTELKRLDTYFWSKESVDTIVSDIAKERTLYIKGINNGSAGSRSFYVDECELVFLCIEAI